MSTEQCPRGCVRFTRLPVWLWLLFAVQLTEARLESNGNGVVKCFTGLPRYKLVNYLAMHFARDDIKMSNLSIGKETFLAHIHFAWDVVEKHISTVKLACTPGGTEILGANLVLQTARIPDMFSPGEIYAVVDFVINCYSWARPITNKRLNSKGYISAIRSTQNLQVNKEIIEETTRQFLKSTEHGDYHFLWEKFDEMNAFLLSLNYVKLACGDWGEPQHVCDWQLVGVDKKKSQNQCLYVITNEIGHCDAPAI